MSSTRPVGRGGASMGGRGGPGASPGRWARGRVRGGRAGGVYVWAERHRAAGGPAPEEVWVVESHPVAAPTVSVPAMRTVEKDARAAGAGHVPAVASGATSAAAP